MARSQHKPATRNRRRHLEGVEVIGRGIMRAAQQPQGPGKTKRERWEEWFPRRLSNILHAMEVMKPLADAEFYEYREAEWKAGMLQIVAGAYDIVKSFETAGKVRHRDVLEDGDRSLDTLRSDLLDDLSDVL